MPEIAVGAQIFDLSFHPNSPVVYLGLLTGDVKAFRYDEQGQSEESFSLRPSKRSCRGLAMSEDGSHLYAVGKGKSLHTIDTSLGKIILVNTAIHDAPINRIKRLQPRLLCTGDDDGVVKLWDSRKEGTVRDYSHHYDFISDFMWIEDKKQLVVTSGDGTLSVIDVRSSKKEPLVHSEDQEDELLSIVPIRGGEKTIVGTQLGILSIFNRSSGWRDCVDRVPGHPHSIDALCTLPSSYPSSHSTILTGSSDGLIRVVQLFPTKLVGTIADHGDFPIERIAVDMGGEGRWVGSVGHDEALHLTDLRDAFEDEEDEEDEKSSVHEDDDESSDSDEKKVEDAFEEKDTEANKSNASEESENDGEGNEGRRKRKVKEMDPLQRESRVKKKGKEEVVDPSFFSGL